MKIIIGIIAAYVVYFIVNITIDSLKKGNNKQSDESVISVVPEKDEPIVVEGEIKKKK